MGIEEYKVGKDCLIKRSKVGVGSTIGDNSVILCSNLGENCDIEKRNLIRNTNIGDMTYTGSDTTILWANIGKFCCIARTVDIGGNEHNYSAVSMMPTYRTLNKLTGKVTMHQDEKAIVIGNDVWIGSGVVITRKNGIKIGDGAVIGAGAVVTKDVPPYAIVAGVPAKIIKYRFNKEIIDELETIKWWDWSKEKIVDNWDILSKEDISEEDILKLKIIGGNTNE